jgi:hypothetical protein
MLQLVKDRLVSAWQGRFAHGFTFTFGGVSGNRYNNGELALGLAGPCLLSPATGHWPWYAFEYNMLTGDHGSWNLGLLGLTIGRVMVHTIDDETQEVVGPDRPKYYFFFKGINHHQQQFEEIINA